MILGVVRGMVEAGGAGRSTWYGWRPPSKGGAHAVLESKKLKKIEIFKSAQNDGKCVWKGLGVLKSANCVRVRAFLCARRSQEGLGSHGLEGGARRTSITARRVIA